MRKIFLLLVMVFVWAGYVHAIPPEPFYGGQNIIGVDLTDTWTTNWHRVNIKTEAGVILTKDSRYAAKVSSSTANKTTTSGLVSFNCTVTAASFVNAGPASSITSNYWYGTSYLLDGMAVNWTFEAPVSTSFWVNASLGTGSTMYYILQGTK